MATLRSTGGRFVTSLPSMRISPLETDSNPAIMRNSVLFPQPDGPTNTMNSPCPTDRSKDWIIWTESKCFSTFCNTKVAMGLSLSFNCTRGHAIDKKTLQKQEKCDDRHDDDAGPRHHDAEVGRHGASH